MIQYARKTMKHFLWIAAACACLSVECLAGEKPSCVMIRSSEVQLTGCARIDLAHLVLDEEISADTVVASVSPAQKSPWLGASLSLVLPGAGEIYTNNWWKAGAFLVAEAGLLTLYYINDHKGTRLRDYVQDYGNAHWSVVRYAQYSQDHFSPPNGPYNWFIPGTEGLPPWDRVNWAELNRMEQDISQLPGGSYYSHVLPPYNNIEYWKVIGKYQQFNQGWDDAPPSYVYGEPVTPEFTYYATERGAMNKDFTTATTFVAIAVINHVGSAVDAALSAIAANRAVHISLGARAVPFEAGYLPVPTASFRFDF